jgi:hypothetical protein
MASSLWQQGSLVAETLFFDKLNALPLYPGMEPPGHRPYAKPWDPSFARELMQLRSVGRRLLQLFRWSPEVDGKPPEYVANVGFALPPTRPEIVEFGRLPSRTFAFVWDEGISELEQVVRKLDTVRYVQTHGEVVPSPSWQTEILEPPLSVTMQRLEKVDGLRAEIVWQRLDAALNEALQRVGNGGERPWPLRS